MKTKQTAESGKRKNGIAIRLLIISAFSFQLPAFSRQYPFALS
jgi:hypothetical protein